MSKNNHHGTTHLWGEHTSTVLSITLVLFVFGLLMFLEYHSYRTTHDMQERITIKVDLAPDVDNNTAVALKKQIEGFSYVKKVDYISKEEAADLFAEELGDDFVGFLGENPLYPTLMVNFKSGIVPERKHSLINQFTKTVNTNALVTGVEYQENVVNELNDVFYTLSWFLIIFIVLLLFICVILINNTIKIAIYSTQHTIQTMRLVGAKNSFIARPFLWRSILFGFLGGVIADLFLAVGIYTFGMQFAPKLLLSQYLIPYSIMGGGIILVGIIISYFSTLGAVHHFLRK